MSIEFNPHVINRDYFVKNLTTKAVDRFCEKELILRDGAKDVLKENTFHFLEKYNKARAKIAAIPQNTFDETPLAYRLEPRISDITDFNKDVLTPPKFGGIPDMTWWYSFCVDDAEIGKFTGEKKKTQKLDKTIKDNWPRCGCCHKPMWFLGQLDMTQWLQAIHLMTFEDKAKEEWEKSDRHYYSVSGLGHGNTVGLNLTSHDIWWYMFYCDCFSFYNMQGYSAVVQIKHKFPGFRAGVPSFIRDLEKKEKMSKEDKGFLKMLKKSYEPKKDTCLWFEDDYRNAVEKFMEKHKIHPETISPNHDFPGKIPLQFIKGYDLRFDTDYPGVIFDDLSEALYYAKDMDKDLFGSSADYQIFGRPSSQQSEPRYVCSNGYAEEGWKIHRMAPIIRWDDSEHDMTRQMYGCLRCVDSQCNEVYAKMDNSCT